MKERIRNFLFLLLISHSGVRIVQAHRTVQTSRPIIGVLAQSTHGKPFSNLGKSYIVASYVKFLESSGARVVPIRNDLNETQIEKLFGSINGALLPGGMVDLSTSGYIYTAKIIFDLAKKKFDSGGYFPIMGMCLGHQFFANVVNGYPGDIRVKTETSSMAAPLNLVHDYRQSKLFRHIPEDLVKSSNSTPTITVHMHHWSLPLGLFEKNNKLKKFFKVLTSNIDTHGVEFVSTMEARRYPFYSTQWHPEKCPFEWKSVNIPHDLTAILLSQYISNFYVDEARLSKHKFASEEEARDLLIYNYPPVYTGKDHTSAYEQVYIL